MAVVSGFRILEEKKHTIIIIHNIETLFRSGVYRERERERICYFTWVLDIDILDLITYISFMRRQITIIAESMTVCK